MIFKKDSVVEQGYNYSIKKLKELSCKYEICRSDEDLIIEFRNFKIEFFEEGIIISGNDLELGYYLNEFERESDYLSSFQKDVDLVVTGDYPPNLKGFFNKIFVTHYNPNPFLKRKFPFLLILIVVLFSALIFLRGF